MGNIGIMRKSLFGSTAQWENFRRFKILREHSVTHTMDHSVNDV